MSQYHQSQLSEPVPISIQLCNPVKHLTHPQTKPFPSRRQQQNPQIPSMTRPSSGLPNSTKHQLTFTQPIVPMELSHGDFDSQYPPTIHNWQPPLPEHNTQFQQLPNTVHSSSNRTHVPLGDSHQTKAEVQEKHVSVIQCSKNGNHQYNSDEQTLSFKKPINRQAKISTTFQCKQCDKTYQTKSGLFNPFTD